MLRTSARGGKADGLKNKNGRSIPRSFSDVRVVFARPKIENKSIGTIMDHLKLKMLAAPLRNSCVRYCR